MPANRFLGHIWVIYYRELLGMIWVLFAGCVGRDTVLTFINIVGDHLEFNSLEPKKPLIAVLFQKTIASRLILGIGSGFQF